MKLNIKGTQQNNLSLYIDNEHIGTLDNDHHKITLSSGCEYYADRISDMVNDYYNALDNCYDYENEYYSVEVEEDD